MVDSIRIFFEDVIRKFSQDPIVGFTLIGVLVSLFLGLRAYRLAKQAVELEKKRKEQDKKAVILAVCLVRTALTRIALVDPTVYDWAAKKEMIDRIIDLIQNEYFKLKIRRALDPIYGYLQYGKPGWEEQWNLVHENLDGICKEADANWPG